MKQVNLQNKPIVGVVLMTYGSATVAEHVSEYLNKIYKNKASVELIVDFENRYRLVGSSPLVAITKAQAVALEAYLGEGFVVRAGMRHSAPTIAEAVGECKAAGATLLVGIILSPQFSSFIMDGYKSAFIEAGKVEGFDEKNLHVAQPWPTEKYFIQLVASRVVESLAALKKTYGVSAPVVFTTHSLPQRVVERDPNYLKQLSKTIAAVREKLPQEVEWYAGYQSAGHSPEEWLKPDLVDILKSLSEKRDPAVLIAPIQFLSDHLEVLYDLDIAAREQCESFGIAYHRIELPNTHPLFIKGLGELVENISPPTLSLHKSDL